MYIWTGCLLPADFAAQLRARCRLENKTIGLQEQAFTLPQHISLKISFPTDRAPEVRAWLRAYLATQRPFSVSLQAPERIPGVLWLPVAENPTLQALHGELDRQLQQRFAIAQHPLDRSFLFHSTLFQDPDAEKLERMESRLRDLPLPASLPVRTLLVGASPDGTPDTCAITDRIDLA